jgi:hypothetical protein
VERTTVRRAAFAARAIERGLGETPTLYVGFLTKPSSRACVPCEMSTTNRARRTLLRQPHAEAVAGRDNQSDRPRVASDRAVLGLTERSRRYRGVRREPVAQSY